jgi:hypothetical protein
MAQDPFRHHRDAALAMLGEYPALSRKQAGFLGQVCVAPELSARQREWLAKLLARARLPPLAE